MVEFGAIDASTDERFGQLAGIGKQFLLQKLAFAEALLDFVFPLTPIGVGKDQRVVSSRGGS